jgi:transposase
VRFVFSKTLAIKTHQYKVHGDKLSAMQEYKCEQAGKHFVSTDQRAAPSRTCRCCGFKADDMPLNVRAWTCPNCGTLNDRDINAALIVGH